MNRDNAVKCLFILLLALTIPFSTAVADNHIKLSSGQTVYVSVYSNVFSGPKALPYNLASMLSIRNTDMYNTIKVTSADYYDNDGRLLKKYLDKPLILPPLQSRYIYMNEQEDAGGFGANFIVRWESAKDVNVPIIESIMIGVKSGQGISFACQGQVITEQTK